MAGERDDLRLASREGIERFNDARDKLHKLMQGWDKLLPGEGARVADDGDVRLASGFAELICEVSATARIVCSSPGARYCPTLFLAPIDDAGKEASRYVICIDPASAAVSGELLRIDDRLLNGDDVRLQFRDLLRREMEPLIIGIGQIRVVWGERFKGVVIVPFDPNGEAKPEPRPEEIEFKEGAMMISEKIRVALVGDGTAILSIEAHLTLPEWPAQAGEPRGDKFPPLARTQLTALLPGVLKELLYPRTKPA